METAFNLASDYQNLMNMLLHVLNQGENGQNHDDEISVISRKIVVSSTEMTKIAEKLKGKDWVNPNDPMLIAENELMNAAQSIEMAAIRLAELRPKQELEGKVSYTFVFCLHIFYIVYIQVVTDENMTFDDLIIESAKSIANASSSVLNRAMDKTGPNISSLKTSI